MKYLLATIILFFILTLGTLSVLNIVHNKMEEEYLIYYQLTMKMSQLNDTYSLCSGLINANPTQENIESCNLVFKEIETTVEQIKENCPYIYYYTTYISDI